MKKLLLFLVVILFPLSAHAQNIDDLNTLCEPYVPLILKYNWNALIAEEVMFFESSCNPEAINNSTSTGDYSVGLFQLNLYGNLQKNRPSKKWLLDPAHNVQYAYYLYQIYGFYPWSVYRDALKK